MPFHRLGRGTLDAFVSPTSVSHAPLFVSLKGRFANARHHLGPTIRDAMMYPIHFL